MLAHVHIMKTAGQTVCDILRSSFGHNHCDLRCGEIASIDDVKFAKRFYPNLQSISGHSIRPWSELADIPQIRFFTILRDPVKRCLSHYQFDLAKQQRHVDFLTWLKRNTNYQTKFLCHTENADQAIEILERRIGCLGFIEDFDRSLRLLRSWSGHDLHLQHKSRNIARDDSIKRKVMARPAYVEALNKANKADQLVYTHAREVIYPRLLDEFDNREASLQASPRSVIPFWPTAKRTLFYKPLAKAWNRHRTA